LSQRGYETEYRLSLQRAAEAERLYLEKLRRNPRDLEALYGLGCVYAITGDLRRATEIWLRCIETKPNWGEVHISLAWAYYRLGEKERGFRHVEEAHRLGVRLDSHRQIMSRLLEMAEKPLQRALFERYAELRIPLIPLSKTTILGLVFILSFAIYAYSPILEGFPKGGDTPNALSMIKYLEKWWPHFPRWNTEWGCGYPFLTFYHPLGIVSTFLLSKFLKISIFITYKFIMLVSIISSSVSLYLLSLILLEENIAALISAILYLSTPGSFNNLIYFGLYLEHLGYPLFLILMFLLDLYVKTWKKRFLVISIILYTALLLTHLTAAFETLILLTYLIWIHIKNRESFIRFLKTSILFFGFSLSLSAFWYTPFLSFGAFKQFMITSPQTSGPLSIEQLIGIPGSGYTRLAPWTVLLAIIGGIISLKRKINRFFLLWSLVFIFYFEAIRFPIFYPFYVKIASPFRFLPLASMFLSILGGHLAWIFRSHISIKRKYILLPIIFMASLPLTHIQRMEVLNAPDHEETYKLVGIFSEAVNGRISFPGYMGQFHQMFNLFSNESQLFNYQLQSAPNLAWIGMADAYLFKGFGGVEEAIAVSRWYGLEYLFIDEGSDLAWTLDSSHFEERWSGYGYKLLKIIPLAPFASLGDRRKILVVGDRYAYENIFWTLIHTNFDSEMNALVWMNERVDKLDVEKLRNFDIIILYGYSYKNRDKMMQILQQYLMEGGSLLIETGYSPDSEASDLTAPFPIMSTRTGDFGFTWIFTYNNSDILQDVDFTAFSPPRYGDAPWGVSYSFNLTLQPWAETLVWLNGQPIIVTGEYGRGRVVWCGLNLPYHAKSYRNKEEAKLLLRLLNWLSPPGEESSIEVKVHRSIPEKMIIPLSGGGEDGVSVFVRETYFPKWHAYLEVGDKRRKLDVYYSGPGFMLVILPEEIDTPAKLILRYETIRIEYVGYIITLCAIILLIVYVIKSSPLSSS